MRIGNWSIMLTLIVVGIIALAGYTLFTRLKDAAPVIQQFTQQEDPGEMIVMSDPFEDEEEQEEPEDDEAPQHATDVTQAYEDAVAQ
jgi:hypothetical protein